MIIVDVVPAELQLADGTRHERVRVVLTNRRLRVWREVGRRPELILDTAASTVTLDSRYPLIGQPMTWTTDAGDVIVTRMRGCACGSSLKAIRPPTD